MLQVPEGFDDARAALFSQLYYTDHEVILDVLAKLYVDDAGNPTYFFLSKEELEQAVPAPVSAPDSSVDLSRIIENQDDMSQQLTKLMGRMDKLTSSLNSEKKKKK